MSESPPASPSDSADTPSSGTPVDKEDNWGYDLYPERRGEKPNVSWWQVAFFGDGRHNTDNIKCERNVYSCFQNSPLVQLMYQALKASGCEIDLRRHIACEVCDPKVSGGYDPQLNQIVVCQNMARSKGMVQGILTHEMIHMFDACRHKLDFKNVYHLACTEVRAANLTHCSFMSALAQGDASFIRIKQQHAECVKNKATWSVKAVRPHMTEAEARQVVDEVFDKCYADLEPIGRRIRRNSPDMVRAYMERVYYGYEA